MAGDLRVVAFLHALPGQEEAVLAAAQACIGPTRAEAGNDSYVLTRDGKDSSMFVFVEHWKSQAAVDEHMQSSHLQAFAAALAGKLRGAPDIRVLVPV